MSDEELRALCLDKLVEFWSGLFKDQAALTGKDASGLNEVPAVAKDQPKRPEGHE